MLSERYEENEKQRELIMGRIQSILSEETAFKTIFSRETEASNATKEGKMNKNDNILKPKYLFNCSNIHRIRLIRKIGHGVSKQTFQGEYNGVPVAIKMVTRHQSEVKSCLDQLRSTNDNTPEKRSKCYVFSTMKLMKEILLLEQLDHPGFIRLLGYCIRSEESETSDLSERGVASVFELGERFHLNNLQLLSWQDRLRHAIALVEFLIYLEHSPLGSLRVRDFKDGHFLMVDSNIKMIDLDDVDNLEPSCLPFLDSGSAGVTKLVVFGNYVRSCEFGVKCQRGLCVGFNAKQNLKHMNDLFLKRLLFPANLPEKMVSAVSEINVYLDDLDISAQELHTVLIDIFTEFLV
ncbi:hypothetical protein CHS0354_023374 [Potamilus streckersoni]|uniref:Protein kinase domain-containing protein n=1 Tax=Potamilus streckersoni TaxID=2493646 RepID=A0AAE0T5V3_9BIVA|nr:hypothetical protein CHS0354_023374 [Potamilus streckersoni]